jgi:hypothetical protein
MVWQGDSAGYTIYNPSATPVSLKFPPISASMPRNAKLLAKSNIGAGSSAWAIRINPATEEGDLSPVYCGFESDKQKAGVYFPVPPSFAGVRVCAVDERTGVQFGHKMTSVMSGGGLSCLLKFTNDSKQAQTISLSLEEAGIVPDGISTAIHNSMTGETELIIPQNGVITVSVGAESAEYRWLLAGDEQFIAAAGKKFGAGILALTNVYPNPVRSFTHVLYTLPFGRVTTVHLSVVDIMGRTIWEKRIKESSIIGGRRDVVWNATTTANRRVAAGVYVLKMTASDSKGKSVGTFNRRLTVLP